MSIEQQLKQLIESALSDIEDATPFLVEFQWKEKAGKLLVFIDADEGVSLAHCQKISRSLGRQLDETELLGVDYALEVSSPGLDRPLKLHQQYVKNIGRPIKVHKLDGSTQEGILNSVDELGIITVPEGKNNKKGPREIPFAEIDKTFVQIRFK